MTYEQESRNGSRSERLMRIAQVNLQPDYGGAERYTLLLAEGLHRQGHAVTLFCHPAGRLKCEAEQRGIPTEPVAARSQLDPRALEPLANRLRRLKPHVIHLQTSREYVSGALAARLAGVPVAVLSRHMLLPLKPTMRFLFRRLDAVVALSRAVRDNLLHCGIPAEKVHLLYAGVEIEPFLRAAKDRRDRETRVALGVSEGHPLLGMAGRMVEGKGHACLLEATALLLKSGLPVTLALSGEGPLRSELEAQAQRLGIAEQVIFTGFLSDIPTFMAGLDVFILASTCEEVMPLVLMEALAAGCPVVASQVGGVPEIITPGCTGLLTPPGDAAALAETLRKLIGDPCLREKLGEAGRAEVLKRFTLPRMVAATEQLYCDLLAAKHQR